MVKVDLKTLDMQRQMDENPLLDCDATGLFMDTKWAKGNFISITELEQPILVYNVDSSHNSVGSITHKAHVQNLRPWKGQFNYWIYLA